MSEVIAIVSGKGGTGKTSLCAGIAQALVTGGSTVLCIDCDVGLRNLDIALGISHLGALSFQEALSYGLENAAKHPKFEGMSFLTAPMNCPADDIDDETWNHVVHEVMDGFYVKAKELNGQVSGEHGIGHAKKKYLEESVGEAQMNLMRGIKRVFDPQGILNPGKIVD